MTFDFKKDDSTSISSDVAVTLIGANTKFKGNISTHTPIHIDGYFEGEIESDNVIEISESGSFKATVTCRNMLLKGTGSGKVSCTEEMQFTETGVFTGDLLASDLVIVSGAVFDGTCNISKARSSRESL